MENLSRDPIIAFYVKMSKSTEYETKLPIFSETLLRLAFAQILGKFRPLEVTEVILYRKLLLFYYSEKYDSTDDLLEIMQCLSADDQNECFAQYHEIMFEWSMYLRNQLKVYLYKEAFNELLYEWSRRYLQVFGQLSNDLLHMQATEVQKFLWQHDKFLRPWLRSFLSLLPARQSNDTNELEPWTADDLKISKIFADLKSKLNPMVCEDVLNLPLYEGGYKEPPKKRSKTEHVEMLDIQIVRDDTNDALPSNVDESKDPIDQECFDEETKKDTDEETKKDTDEETDIDETDHYDDDGVEVLEMIDSEEFEDNSKSFSEEVQTEKTTRNKTISHDTALKYLSELQAYAVVNGHFDAIGLLDEVDTVFRRDAS